jgi:hypothetical protein
VGKGRKRLVLVCGQEKLHAPRQKCLQILVAFSIVTVSVLFPRGVRSGLLSLAWVCSTNLWVLSHHAEFHTKNAAQGNAPHARR